ncbi:MAG: hypothetical protein V2A73_11895 [Pseudomonadota bacterium]
MTTPQRAHARGKEHERALARRLGGKRVGNTGKATADVQAGWLCVEAKSRRRPLPAEIRDAIGQAVKAAKPEQLAIAVFHQLHCRHDDDVVMLRLSDFEAWFGDVGNKEGEDGE